MSTGKPAKSGFVVKSQVLREGLILATGERGSTGELAFASIESHFISGLGGMSAASRMVTLDAKDMDLVTRAWRERRRADREERAPAGGGIDVAGVVVIVDDNDVAKVQVYKIRLQPVGGGYALICRTARELREQLDEMFHDGSIGELSPGDVVSVTVDTMTKAELDALPEFEGW